MKTLYYMSREPLTNGFPQCRGIVCQHSLKHAQGPHVCMLEELRPGLGRYVYMIKVLAARITDVKYRDLFRIPAGDAYAIPLSLANSYAREEHLFSEMTGRDWDVFDIREYDSPQSVLWASRSDICFRGVSILRLTDEFDPVSDFIVSETTSSLGTRVGVKTSRWHVSVLAGAVPYWVLYPWLWAQWVSNEKVRESALSYILYHFPQVREEVNYALALANRGDRQHATHAWAIVILRLNELVGGEIDLDIGPMKTNDTAVRAIPMKIVEALNDLAGLTSWVPPIPAPQKDDSRVRVRIEKPLPTNPFRSKLYNRRSTNPTHEVVYGHED